MKCLQHYSVKEFEYEVRNNLKIDGWMIRDGNPQNRIKETKNKDYFKKLQLKAKKSKFIYAQDLEIISWLDTMNLLFHTLSYLDKNLKQEITVVQEYKIPFSNKRADYLLLYRNKILIIEFSYDNFGNEYRYESKLTQAIGYKELLANMLPQNIRLATYTFIINPEMSEKHKEYYKFDRYSGDYEQANNEKMKEFASYIELFFKQTEQSAVFALNQLEDKINDIDSKKIEDWLM